MLGELPCASSVRIDRDNEFQRVAGGLQTAFLAELLQVSKQMVCRYRRKGAPARRVEQVRAYLREVTERAA